MGDGGVVDGFGVCVGGECVSGGGEWSWRVPERMLKRCALFGPDEVAAA